MRKKIISVIATVLCAVMFFTLPCNAAKTNAGYYSDLKKVANKKISTDIGTYNFTSMQGMAVGSKYAYTAKLPVNSNGDVIEDYATIVRTDTTNGNQTTLTFLGKQYVKGLGHANDMCVTSIDNKSTLFISASNSANTKEINLIKMPVTGSTILKNGYFKVKYNNKPIRISGLTILNKNSDTITFLFKNGNNIYTGSIGTHVGSGTINVKKVFTINTSSVTINGKTENFSNYSNQGFSYYNNKLYVALSGNGSNSNKSVMLVYNNIGTYIENNTTSETVYASNDISFKITSKTYSNLFEIESCGICSGDGKLYFNTNRRKTASSSDWDGVHYIDGYNVK